MCVCVRARVHVCLIVCMFEKEVESERVIERAREQTCLAVVRPDDNVALPHHLHVVPGLGARGLPGYVNATEHREDTVQRSPGRISRKSLAVG